MKLKRLVSVVCLFLMVGGSWEVGAYNEIALKRLKAGFCRLCDLSNANLTNANLSGFILISANLNGANLTNANLTETLMEGAQFNNANLNCNKIEYVIAG